MAKRRANLLLLHSENFKFTQKAPASYKLTRREEQCLKFTAKSWRVEQIAKELKISPRTVNFHIQNANKKLGSQNKYQAVYKFFEEWNSPEDDAAYLNL